MGIRDDLVDAYYHATLPLRWGLWEAAKWNGALPLMTLFYHRVADHAPNPWTLTNAQFRSHLDWLANNFEFLSLAEIQRRLASGHVDSPGVAITFDDGYAENCDQALPLLIERGIPVTYFVATSFVLENRPFPHDLQRGVPLSPNTPRQLREMAEAGVSLGAHTRTHVNLGGLACRRTATEEILGGRDELQQLTGQSVEYFAFPYGQPRNCPGWAARICREAGFHGVVSACGGYNAPTEGSVPFHLRRIHGDPELPRVRNWLTLDPLKLWASSGDNHWAAELAVGEERP